MRAYVVTLLLLAALPQGVWGGWQADGNPVCTLDNVQASPVAIPDGAGGAIVAWVDNRTGVTNLYAQRLNAEGAPQWSPLGESVCTANGIQFGLDVMSDGSGGAIMVWMDYRSGNADIYAQRIDGSGAPQWTVNGVAVSVAANSQMYPRMVSNGSGGAFVVWEDHRSIAVTGENIYGTRLTSAGAVLDPAGIAVHTGVGSQRAPSLTPYGTGGAIVVWQHTAPVTLEDIVAARVTGTGTVVDVAGLSVCNTTASQYSPACVTDGSGGAIICWPDYRVDSGIYAQRLTSLGAISWIDDGVQVSDAGLTPSSQRPGILDDGSGGAMLMWTASVALDYNVYAQHIDASGTRQWLPNDVPVCVTSGTKSDLRITSDGAGGVLAAWNDARDGEQFDIYAQRIGPSGSTQWTANGVPVCEAEHAQTLPTVVSDGGGGAVIAWQDDRTDTKGSESDIYAQHVQPNGDVPTAVESPAPSFSVRDAYPNPFSRTTELTLSLHEDTDVTIDVFDVRGRRVREFSLPEARAGELSVFFDGTDRNGRELPSGVYFWRATARGASETRKLVLLK